MVNCKLFYGILMKNEIDFFTGVPDSLLKDFCAYVTDNTPKKNNIIAANEGNTIALAAGHYLATGKPGLVYMQNSGLGNAINPLTSLADKEVYSIPMLLLIGWRGRPGVKDEPQHVKQGRITLSLLDTLEIPYEIFPEDFERAKSALEKAVYTAKNENKPYALIVKEKTFEPYELKNKIKTDYELNREEAIKLVTEKLTGREIIVSTTGMTSRELFEYREESKEGHDKDFLTVGGMG